MRDPQSVTVKKATLTVSLTEQRYYLVHEGDKLAALTNLFEIEPITSALIFVRTRVETGQLASQLSSRGFPAEAINGDLEQNAREQILGRFRAGQIKVLVATDVAARGLDIDNISHVFNYHLPDDAEVYVHRIGRTGRAGKTGIAISLFAPREKRRLREIEHMTKQALTLGKLPTAADIHQHRENQLLEQLKVWLGRGRYQRERELVARLVEEGFDPMEIAAAALKLSRADEKQRPVANVTDVVVSESRSSYRGDRGDREYGRGKPQGRDGKRDYSKRGDRDSGNKRSSHEAGMIRLKLNKGKENGVRPNDIVGTIAHHADIPGSSIGKIHIEEKFTYVDVPQELVEKVLKHNGNYRIGKDKFTLVKS